MYDISPGALSTSLVNITVMDTQLLYFSQGIVLIIVHWLQMEKIWE